MENLFNKDYEYMLEVEHSKVMADLSQEIFHDFKNTLATISGLAQLSMMKTQLDDVKAHLNHINLATFELRDALDKYYRFTCGNSEPLNEPVSLQEIIFDTVEMIQFRLNSAKSKELRLDLNIKSNSLVLCNKYDLKQSFLNIMMNSLDSMEDLGGVLSVSIYSNDDNSSIIVDIIDTGTGISEKHLKEIFKGGFTTKYNGTGLGLKISKNCVEKHKGTINVTSIPNKGTKVQIALPIYNGIDIH